MNDIQILREMLTPNIQVTLQPGQGRPSVQLTDLQSGATVEIKGIPPHSIVIRAEDFENPLTVFNGTKGERKRADFVIVSNDERGRKWIICIETQEMDAKLASHVVQQLKGAYCFITYCQCIGKSFWASDDFLNGYQYRFVSIVELNFNRSKRRTQPFQSMGQLHNRPEIFLKISRSPTVLFHKLIDPVF
ncbi:type I restriction enzyme HsdR N-terminal domain-containing protein [Candidatus Poribacteria bacterium]|nr:type I restriction enzyme HsdR N-terminal domain-containing protein [Candidatus Poribacteria bacterium]MYA57920.1 type I restriction enzyme HsdR N-terminal domain-containing protein [Candidatus Poribacteria bacterium]